MTCTDYNKLDSVIYFVILDVARFAGAVEITDCIDISWSDNR